MILDDVVANDRFASGVRAPGDSAALVDDLVGETVGDGLGRAEPQSGVLVGQHLRGRPAGVPGDHFGDLQAESGDLGDVVRHRRACRHLRQLDPAVRQD